jgi:ribose 5-phosphate isomerase B
MPRKSPYHMNLSSDERQAAGVLTPNDFSSLADLEQRLIAFLPSNGPSHTAICRLSWPNSTPDSWPQQLDRQYVTVILNQTTKLRVAGHEVVDYSAAALTPDDDYPDFVVPLARAVAVGKVERGVAICGSGVGASVCANKIPGVRAGLIHDHFSARQGVEDDHMNIICMGGRTVGSAVAWDLVETFLAARFSQAERHLRRLGKVASLEAQTTRYSDTGENL